MEKTIALHAFPMLPSPFPADVEFILDTLKKETTTEDEDIKMRFALKHLPRVDVYTDKDIYSFHKLSNTQFLVSAESGNGWGQIKDEKEVLHSISTLSDEIELIDMDNRMDLSTKGVVLFRKPNFYIDAQSKK
jgi:hypothetical protein